MPAFRTESLSGWGRHPVQPGRVYRPESRAEAAEVLRAGGERSYVPRGLGRSYGDAALNDGGGVLLGVRLNRFLDWDPTGGVVECEAGVSFDDLLRVLLPRGFFPAVTPGTRFVTVGGAVACDVHGKNHPRDGSFARWMQGLRLLLPSGETLDCSPAENAEVFHATTGGMGLTGLVLSARFAVRRVETAWAMEDVRRTRDLDGALEAMEAEPGAPYRVAWMDCLSRGAALGRSVVRRGDHAPADALPASVRDPLSLQTRRPLPFPARLASPFLRRASMRAFNAVYHAAHGSGDGRLVDAASFFYPLDAARDWNRMYGPRGFVQYQFVLPPETARAGLRMVLERLSGSPHPGFLAVLKRMGPAGDGLLSFPREGWTLAVDLPVAAGLEELLRVLDRTVLDHGGRVYLAKDAHLDPASFARMYPAADRFREVKRRLDPAGRLSSSLARRVGLVEARDG
jgi:decaprenylphospho-beta-D-ribofuranose 2-oxidase